MVTATGTSDTHSKAMISGWRTFVEMGIDDPAQFTPQQMASRLNGGQAQVTTGPFVKVSAYRVDASGTQVTASTGPGGTVAQDARDLGISLDLQVPEYLDVTKVELYMHKPQDDLACPIDSASPKATTTRVACDGVANSNWPSSGVTASQVLSFNSSDLQNVVTDVSTGTVFRRYRRQVSFQVPSPTTDNWVVAMVYGTRSLYPLNYTGGMSFTAPFAITNPIWIDADGNGYDKPPFKAAGNSPRKTSHHAEQLPVQSATSVQEALRRWGSFVQAR
jgi:hypothetical protein